LPVPGGFEFRSDVMKIINYQAFASAAVSELKRNNIRKNIRKNIDKS